MELASRAGARQNLEVEWVVTLVAVGALVAGVAGSMARAGRRASVWQDEVEARWRQVAERIGGRLEVGPRRHLAPRRLVLLVAREDVVAALDVNVPVDPGAPSHTRARARFALGRGPVFRAWDPDVGEPVTSPSVLPEPALARRLRVTTDEVEPTRAAFSPAACAHAAALTRAIELRSNGEELELVWNGIERDGETLAHALGLVAELAQLGTGALRQVAALADATYVPVVDGGPMVRVQREHVDVTIELVPMQGGAPRHRASAATRRALPSFEIAVDGASMEGALPAGVLDPEASPLLAEVGTAALACAADRVELSWSVEPTLAQADAGARLVALVAAGSTRRGAFR